MALPPLYSGLRCMQMTLKNNKEQDSRVILKVIKLPHSNAYVDRGISNVDGLKSRQFGRNVQETAVTASNDLRECCAKPTELMFTTAQQNSQFQLTRDVLLPDEFLINSESLVRLLVCRFDFIECLNNL